MIGNLSRVDANIKYNKATKKVLKYTVYYELRRYKDLDITEEGTNN